MLYLTVAPVSLVLQLTSFILSPIAIGMFGIYGPFAQSVCTVCAFHSTALFLLPLAAATDVLFHTIAQQI